MERYIPATWLWLNVPSVSKHHVTNLAESLLDQPLHWTGQLQLPWCKQGDIIFFSSYQRIQIECYRWISGLWRVIIWSLSSSPQPASLENVPEVITWFHYILACCSEDEMSLTRWYSDLIRKKTIWYERKLTSQIWEPTEHFSSVFSDYYTRLLCSSVRCFFWKIIFPCIWMYWEELY